MRDEGGNEVGIHNENHNRFLRMSSSTLEPWETHFFRGFFSGDLQVMTGPWPPVKMLGLPSYLPTSSLIYLVKMVDSP